MRLLVTGSGRCGTKWVAERLWDAGIDVGHEEIFPKRPHDDRWEAEVAWHAAPYTPLPYTHTVHLVRHPVATCRSRVEKDGAFDTYPLSSNFAYDWVPALHNRLWTPLQRAGVHWVKWNRMIVASEVIRLEDVTPDVIGRLARVVDPSASSPDFKQPIPSTAVTLSDKEELRRVPRFQETAEWLGYRV